MTLGVKLQGDKYDITIIFEIDGYESIDIYVSKEDRGYYSIAIHQFSLKQLIFIQILLLNDI